jgi:deoxyribodipyrimidine photo-lyase
MKTAIFWFRNDLRLHDNRALTAACAAYPQVLMVYCLDPRLWQDLDLGFKKTGVFRTQFLLESLSDLKQNLQQRGSDLLLLEGKPETALPILAQKVGATRIFASQEATSEEISVEESLKKNLPSTTKLQLFWQSTLHLREDLNFEIQHLPDVFTQYRKKVENKVRIHAPLPAATTFGEHTFSIFSEVAAFNAQYQPLGIKILECVPPLADFGFESQEMEKAISLDARAVLPFKGGETAALARLQDYFWEKDALRNYKETRNGLIGADYSSKFSAWLALGSLSPRQIYSQVQRYERERVANDSTYWLVFELLWRDYFRWVALKFGNRLFWSSGLKGEKLPTKPNKTAFEKWKNARTGQPFIDANMKELALTGFMSNRGRQNVASYLVKDLKVEWRWGATYFESQLIDYDVASNWGNWAYVAGVGNDPRENRYFNPKTQAERYDPKGEYVDLWLKS